MLSQVPTGILITIAISFLIGAALIWMRRNTYEGPAYRRLLAAMEDYIAISLLVTMLLVSILQIVSRTSYVESFHTFWTEELALLAMVWLAFWTASVAARTQDHINLSFVYDLCSPRVQKLLDIFGHLMTILVLSPVFWFGFWAARRAESLQTVTLGVPVAVFAYAVPVAMALIVFHNVVHLIARIRS